MVVLYYYSNRVLHDGKGLYHDSNILPITQPGRQYKYAWLIWIRLQLTNNFLAETTYWNAVTPGPRLAISIKSTIQRFFIIRTRGRQVLGKVSTMVVAHVPMKDIPEVLSHLTQLNNTSLLEAETGHVGPSEPHSISLSSTLLIQRGRFYDCPKYEKGNVQPPVAGQSYHITQGRWDSTRIGAPCWLRRLDWFELTVQVFVLFFE